MTSFCYFLGSESAAVVLVGEPQGKCPAAPSLELEEARKGQIQFNRLGERPEGRPGHLWQGAGAGRGSPRAYPHALPTPPTLFPYLFLLLALHMISNDYPGP